MKKYSLKTIKTVLIVVLALSLVLSACGGSADPAPMQTTEDGSRETLPAKPQEDPADATTEAPGPQTDTTPETTEAVTGETETTEAETTEPQPEETTEETTGAETTEPAPQQDPAARRSEAGSKFQHLLAERIEDIEAEHMVIYDPNGDADRRMQVMIADIYGDDIPEVVFVKYDTALGYGRQLLTGYTYVEDHVELLFEEPGDFEAGGGQRFCLFVDGEDKEPWLVRDGGEYMTRRASAVRLRYERSGEGKYVWTGTRFDCVEFSPNAAPGETEGEESWTFTGVNGEENLTREEYYGRLDPILADAQPLIHNYSEHDLPDWLQGKAMKAMTYDEALRALDDWWQEAAEPEQQEGAADGTFDTVAGEYYQHGGDWSTWLTVNADGSFTGEYSAHYFSNDKRHYDVGEFHGSLADLRQQDKLTWTVYVESVTVDGEAGEKWTGDDGEEYERIADPASPKQGSTLTVYLPGTDTQQITEEFFMWIRSSREQMPKLEGTALIGDGAYYYMPPAEN